MEPNATTNRNEKTNVVIKKQLTEEQKEAMKQKRLLNPTFAQIVSRTKKENEILKRSNLNLLLFSVKEIVKTIKEDSFNQYENENYQNKCKKFVNYLLTTTKDKETNENVFKYQNLVNDVFKYAKKNNAGLYSEYNLSNIIGGIIKITIDKNFDYQTAVNYYNAIQRKKETK